MCSICHICRCELVSLGRQSFYKTTKCGRLASKHHVIRLHYRISTIAETYVLCRMYCIQNLIYCQFLNMTILHMIGSVYEYCLK